ncbi:hypothetical protein F5876DRAFT_84377 [Lentinula aff. lateritia]|uniref:Uncharacterized protein n=1 Tax=Lentinula aff. lateritia TaxID=2804960 RepID=A0ACC1TGU0_9AGAR|nr:hypothetical protein F5876DRAFT_84377 [Lentinula aff. lateritia]
MEESIACGGLRYKGDHSIIMNEASGGDPDDGNDEEDEERAPCERCYSKRIPCLEQVRRDGGPSGKRMAVMESQMAQGLANVRSLQEARTQTNQYLHQILRRQEEMNGRLIAIETRLSMAGPATPGPSRTASEKPRLLKRRRVEEETEDEEKEEEEEEEEQGERNEEGNELALKKARSEKGKEIEE